LVKETSKDWLSLRRDSLVNVLKAKWQVNQEELQCYMTWQMMMAMLHSNEQQRTEKNRQTFSAA